jgi:hypothetical protein
LGFTASGGELWTKWGELCCACGLCTLYACPEDLFPKEACDRAKRTNREHGIRWTGAGAGVGDKGVSPHLNALWGCYFCSKPLPDREEGDVIALRMAGESRHALICRGCSRRYRQKNVPPVRVVRSGGRVRHWATVADYDPFYDYYHDDRHGRDTQPLAELEELFITPAGPANVFVEGGGRPDYVLRVEELRSDT